MICQCARSSFRKAQDHSRQICALSLIHSLIIPLFAVAANEPVDYQKQIKPIIAARCKACHGALKQEGGLRLDTGALARKGGDSGEVIVPGKSASSPLIDRITATDLTDRMPQEGEPLTAAQIGAFRDWIDQGAASPVDEQADNDPREHWAFRPIVKPPVPKV